MISKLTSSSCKHPTFKIFWACESRAKIATEKRKQWENNNNNNNIYLVIYAMDEIEKNWNKLEEKPRKKRKEEKKKNGWKSLLEKGSTKMPDEYVKIYITIAMDFISWAFFLGGSFWNKLSVNVTLYRELILLGQLTIFLEQTLQLIKKKKKKKLALEILMIRSTRFGAQRFEFLSNCLDN